jgi:heat-inducible transcriptional repressor
MFMELDTRKQQVLRAVVMEYVRTAEPVGSERLADSHAFSAKAATLRNEMAALSTLGYLRQPHTSAGRIPSDKGYRFYVDRLMTPDIAAPRLPTIHFDAELEEVLRQTCRLLTGITKCAAIATPPTRETVTVRQIHITAVGEARALVVTLLSSGQVEHRLVDIGKAVAPSALTRLENVFNEHLGGLSLDAARVAPVTLAADMSALAGVAAKVRDVVAEIVTGDDMQDTVVEGATQVLREPEFQDEDRRERLLQALEDRRRLLESLRALDGAVDVMIGAENPQPEMHEFSFVSTRYFVGTRMTGIIGVFGPTRMAYSSAIPAVRSMARRLGALLTDLART